MESQGGHTHRNPAASGPDDTVWKKRRTQLEARMEAQRRAQVDVLAALQALVPDMVSSLDLSLHVVSTFNHRPFTPTPPLPPPPQITKKPLHLFPASSSSSSAVPGPAPARDDHPLEPASSRPSPLSVVRAMVAECLLQRVPFDPIDSSTVLRKLENDADATPAERAAMSGGEVGPISAVEAALRAIAEENRGAVELEEFVVSGKGRLMVLSIDRNRLVRELPETSLLDRSSTLMRPPPLAAVQQQPDAWAGGGGAGSMWQRGGGGMAMGQRGIMQRPTLLSPQQQQQQQMQMKLRTEEDDLKDVEALLNKKSFKELQKSKTGEELLDLIHRPTAKETAVAAKFKTKGGSQLKEYCSALTKEDCVRQSGSFLACEKVHFRRIIAPHTDVSQGDCSFLDTCRHMKTCKYVHYELDPTLDVPHMMMGAVPTPSKSLKPQRAEYCSEVELGEPQWINCDIRSFKMEILGQFGVIMADPPWDIHMELPYGTMADDEMRNLNVPVLQTDGLIFLWVTGRAMELGRECLDLWGYKRVEEIIWVKTNQLQRIIRTGRTGHWLNHSKEHCLVGIKGDPLVNRNIDTDVIVAEVRETSRKPDEMYPLLERISPRTRKLELFARMHNTQAGWMSLGNQLEGVRLVDDGLRARFKAAYPEVAVQPASPPRATAIEVDSTASQIRKPFTATDPKSSAAQSMDHAASQTYEGKQPMAVDTNAAA